MVNGTGLGGSYTSAQSGIVINYPGSSTKYIAFAVDQWYRNTLNYAIIDMSLQGGLGEVTEKGTLGDKGGSIRACLAKAYQPSDIAISRTSGSWLRVKVQLRGGCLPT